MNSRNPRVLVLPPSYYATNRVIGGGERYALEYARAMNSLTPTELGLFDLKTAEKKDGSLTIRHFAMGVPENQGMVFRMPRSTWKSLAAYDVIHFMCFPTPLSDTLLPIARTRGQMVVLTDIGGGGTTLSGYLMQLHPRLNLHRLANGLAHLSNYSARFFADWKQPSTVLLGGTPEFPQITESPNPGSGGYALFVGRLLPHKGVLEIIQAIDATMPLKIVGRVYDQPYFDRLRDAASRKKVTFITDASDEDLHQLYGGASVVLQPSLPSASPDGDKSELLGLAALEGMAHARPVIVTRTASLPELVVNGSTGFIIEPHNPAELREKIGFFLNNPDAAREFGIRARDHVKKHFTWEATARRGFEFYQRLFDPAG